MASRIDCYTDNPTVKFGEALRHQVEERLAFYEVSLVLQYHSRFLIDA